MVRSRCLFLLVLALVAAALACNRIRASKEETGPDAATERPLPAGPSVLLVTIDTLRADHVGSYGDTRGSTPTLDALAAEGSLFETAVATAPVTLPSHATLLTGMTPPLHGVRHNGIYVLDSGVERLAERFATAGYDTGAVVGAVVLARGFGLEQGFDHYDDAMSSRVAASGGYLERDAAAVTDAALAWLRGRREPQRPFFLWVHYYDPHAAYQPPSPHRERFASDPYTGEIAHVDTELGRLVAALRADGRLERTLVSVTSDHGESLGEHGELTHSYLLYDATQRVPWILRGPGVARGRRVEGVVSGADLGPTLLGLLGLPRLRAADGRDLAAWLDPARFEPPGALRGPAYAETLATRIDHGWAPLHALRTDTHLFVRAPRPELYELARDPAQRENVLPRAADPDAWPEPARRLEADLDRVLALERGSERVAVSDETRAQLQALGYALPDAPVPATDIDPKDAIRFVKPFEMARGLYEEGHAEQALEVVRPIHAELPTSPRVNELLTLVYLALGRPTEALTHAEACLALGADFPHHHVLEGLARVGLRQVPEAVQAFERARTLDPRHADALLGLMWRLKLGGTLEETEAIADEVIALQPTSAELRRQVADNWDRFGEYERALARYREAVELDPRNVQAHLGIAVNMARLGRMDELARHAELAGPAAKGIGGRMRLAIALASRGDAPRAEEILRGILRDDPSFDGAKRVLARLLENTGRAEEAQGLRR